MSSIYKFYHNIGSIDLIYIFVGDLLYSENITIDDINKAFEDKKASAILEKVFEKEELEKIYTNDISVEFVDDNIYDDDTIETIKFKLLKNLDGDYSYEEIYMHGFTNYHMDHEVVYNELTNRGRMVLDRIILSNFLNNIGSLF